MATAEPGKLLSSTILTAVIKYRFIPSRLLRCALLLIACLLTHSSRAQYTNDFNYNFMGFTVADGLKDNTVVKSITDKNGFLWLATHNGISRFDGRQFKTYTHDPKDSSSLRSIWVSDITKDDKQRIWASTEWGLCYYDEGRDRFIYINERKHLQLVYKMPLCHDADAIWIAAEDGLKKVNTQSKTYRTTALNRIVDPQFVIKRSPNELLIGTRGYGLLKYDISKDIYQRIALPGLPGDIHLMDALQEGSVTWIASSVGLITLDAGDQYQLYNRALSGVSVGPVEALMCLTRFGEAVGPGYFICGTYDKKLLLFDIANRQFSFRWQPANNNRNSFTSSIVYSLLADNKKLWIGTNKGLQLVNLEAQQQQTFFIPELREGDNYNFVRKAVFDDNTQQRKVWLIPGEPMDGLMLYDLAEKKMVRQWRQLLSKKRFITWMFLNRV